MGVVMPIKNQAGGEPSKHVIKEDSTDLALFVRTSQDDMMGWDRQRIVDALMRETFVDRILLKKSAGI